MIRIQALGNLGADAEIIRIEGSQYVAIKFSVGVTEKYTDKNNQKVSQTRWIRCTYWKKSDNTKIAEYLKKGMKVYVEGIPSASAFVNKENKPTASLEMSVQNITLAGSVVMVGGGGAGTPGGNGGAVNGHPIPNYFPPENVNEQPFQVPADENFDDLPF